MFLGCEFISLFFRSSTQILLPQYISLTSLTVFILLTRSITCLCGRVVNALGRHMQYSVTRSVAGVKLGPGASVYQRIICNNSYAHDEQ